jgi:hypothetical protein
MAAIVGIDAKVEISTDGGSNWTELPERNEFSISINVDVAEHKVFVESLADAWVDKSRTWMSWSGSLSGYYDDADDQIFDAVVAGELVDIRFFVSRNSPKFWTGKGLLTSVEHGSNTDDYATLNVDFEGVGALGRGELVI